MPIKEIDGIPSSGSTFLKDMFHIKRPFDANINVEPKECLSKAQRKFLLEKVLPGFIIAYKKRMLDWLLVEDIENGKAYNNYVGGFNPNKTHQKILTLKKEASKIKVKREKLVIRLKDKGNLTPLQSERLCKFNDLLKGLELKQKNLEKDFNLGKFYHADGKPRLQDDDIGQESVIFFYRCLDKFDLTPYAGAIDTYNHKSVEGRKTKKTLEFYFQNFAFNAITNMAKDAVKRLVSYGFSPHNSESSNVATYAIEAAIVASHFIDEVDELEEFSFEQVVKIDLIDSAVANITDTSFKKFVISRIHLPKDMVQQQYKKDFASLNSRFLELKKDILISFEYEKRAIETQGKTP